MEYRFNLEYNYSVNGTKDETKKKLLKRLKRIEIQVVLLKTIVEEGKSAEDVFVLHAKIAKSLEKVNIDLFDYGIEDCFQEGDVDIKEILKTLKLSR